MDPADSDAIKHALASQGQLVTQHDKTLHKLMAAVQALSLSVTQIGSQLDEVTTHRTNRQCRSCPPWLPLSSGPLQPSHLGSLLFLLLNGMPGIWGLAGGSFSSVL